MDSPPTQETVRTPRNCYAQNAPHFRGDASVTDGPLIVQSDKTLLLEVDHPPVA